jgi:hypothetical protein
VQYDKHGWRNRNQIKTSQGKQWLTVPVHSGGATGGLLIQHARIDWTRPWAASHWKTVSYAYGRAPFFKQYAPLMEPFFQRRDEFLADLTIDLTVALARALGISHTRFVRSSELTGITGEKTDRLIQILRQVGATHYVSGPSARDYIEQEKFEAAGITLEYMTYDYPEYPQLYPPFEPQVSALDLLFMTGSRALEYVLTPGERRV